MKILMVTSVSILFSITALAQNLKPLNYADGEQKLKGLITSNSGKKLPGILILPAWKGIDQEAKDAALNLQKEGYTALIADIYGEGNAPTDNASAAKLSSTYKQDYKLYQHRIELALAELKKTADANNIAVIGYCFGGTGALETARAGFAVKGVVSIHGGLAKAPERTHAALPLQILIENPADDTSVKAEDMANLINEMNEGKADWQIITYAHSKHTFTDPKSPDYNPAMAKRAWQHTLMFLKDLLK